MRHSLALARRFAFPTAYRYARRIAFLAVLILPIVSVSAQQTQTAPGTGAAFVSRLAAQPVGFQIKLTWLDAPGFTGACIIYRGTEELTTQSLPKALRVGSVPTGVGYFVDTPPDRSDYFYAVALQDAAGTAYSLLVPFRNKTSIPVAVQTTAPEETLAASIDKIKASLTGAGDSIQVSFTTSNPTRDLLLFWGPAPLTTPEDLLRSTTTTPLDPGSTRYVVAALPGVDYWFAVLDAGLYKIGKTPLVKGANVTSAPVQVPVTAGHLSLSQPSIPRRALPLPSLSLTRDVESNQLLADDSVPTFPVEKAIDPTTEKAIAGLRSAAPGTRHMPRGPSVLHVDTTPSPSGEVARLLDIVQGPFLGGDMATTERRISDFLSLPRSPELEAHARFYLGQVYFVAGRTRDALLEFLEADEFYYQETEPWVDACFEILERADR